MFNAIIMPIAKVLGYIFNLLFEALSFLHIGNVAVAIVLFTIIVKNLSEEKPPAKLVE